MIAIFIHKNPFEARSALGDGLGLGTRANGPAANGV